MAFSLLQGAVSFFRTIISNMEKVYLTRNPTAKAILDLVRSCDGDHICYDHFAFRTFGVYTKLVFLKDSVSLICCIQLMQ